MLVFATLVVAFLQFGFIDGRSKSFGLLFFFIKLFFAMNEGLFLF